MGPAHTSMSTVGCESGVIHMGREEAKNKEFQEVTILVKMDFGLSIEKEIMMRIIKSRKIRVI